MGSGRRGNGERELGKESLHGKPPPPPSQQRLRPPVKRALKYHADVTQWQQNKCGATFLINQCELEERRSGHLITITVVLWTLFECTIVIRKYWSKHWLWKMFKPQEKYKGQSLAELCSFSQPSFVQNNNYSERVCCQCASKMRTLYDWQTFQFQALIKLVTVWISAIFWHFRQQTFERVASFYSN